MNRLILVIVSVLLLHNQSAFAQDDPVFDQPIMADALDSLTEIATPMQESSPFKLRDPKRAALFSAVVPGLGQAYNNKYWKIPLIYGGFFALGYYIDWNNDNYNFYRNALFEQLNNNTNSTGFSESQLRSITDEFRRNRDILIILTGVLYGLNIIDAHVDAHLKEFDINEDLALSVQPASVNTLVASGAGLSIALKIK